MTDITAQSRHARPPNWLPLPGAAAGAADEPQVDEDDSFPKGEIVRYFPNRGYGFLRTAKGDEIFFRLAELDLVGPKADPRYLKVGGRIGYDVSWTSKGLHVRTMKVY